MIDSKKIFFLLLAAFLSRPCFAQSNDGLKQVIELLKDPYTPVEKLERASANLRLINKNNLSTDDQQLLMNCQQKVAKGYEANNHFKQACEVYYDYLSLKEKFLANEKAEALKKVVSNVDSIKKSTEAKVQEMQQELTQLQSDHERASSRSAGIIRYFVFGILLLVFIFLIVFLRGNMILKRNKEELENGQKRLKELQRDNVLGYHYSGVVAATIEDVKNATHLLNSVSDTIDNIGKSSDKGGLAIISKISEVLLKAEKEIQKISY